MEEGLEYLILIAIAIAGIALSLSYTGALLRHQVAELKPLHDALITVADRPGSRLKVRITLLQVVEVSFQGDTLKVEGASVAWAKETPKVVDAGENYIHYSFTINGPTLRGSFRLTLEVEGISINNVKVTLLQQTPT